MAKFTVQYQVTFECEIEVDDVANLDDIISDIDIPEGGKNNSVYVPESIEIFEARGNGKCLIATEEPMIPVSMVAALKPLPV